MYPIALIQDQRTHLGVTNGELELGHRQLGRLAVSIGPLQHPVDEGRCGRLGCSLCRQGGTARHRGGSRRRTVPLRGTLNGPPLARNAADAHVGRHLLQNSGPRVPNLTAAPAADGADDQPDRRIVDKAHSPRTKFNSQVSYKHYLI
jgi:hypothetical protein